MDKKNAAISGLVALILASAGGATFLHKHPNPTQKDVFAACEKGDLDGIVCCEDAVRIDFGRAMTVIRTGTPLSADEAVVCGAVRPGSPDPLGVRKKEEAEWEEKKG